MPVLWIIYCMRLLNTKCSYSGAGAFDEDEDDDDEDEDDDGDYGCVARI